MTICKLCVVDFQKDAYFYSYCAFITNSNSICNLKSTELVTISASLWIVILLTRFIPCLIMSLPAPWELQANFCLLDAGFSVLYICSLIGSISLGLSLSAWLNPPPYPKEKLGGRSTHIGHYQSLSSPIEIRSLSRACIPAYQTLLPDKRPWKEGLLTHWGWCAAVCVCVLVQRQHCIGHWIGSGPSLAFLSPIQTLEWVLTARQAASEEHNNESITFTSIHVPIPPGMSRSGIFN